MTVSPPNEASPIPVMDHLYGPHRGDRQRLTGETLHLGTAPEADLHFPADRSPGVGAHHATLERTGAGYLLLVDPGHEVFVNGEAVTSRHLTPGDTVRLGAEGPVLRYRLLRRDARYKSLSEALGDCGQRAAHESPTKAGQAWHFVRAMPDELMRQTSPLTRVGVLAVLLMLMASTVVLAIRTDHLERRLEDQTLARIGLAEQADRQALTLQALEDVRTRLEARVEALEARSEAAERVVASASPAVAFLQGSYGFLNPGTGDTLRLLVGPGGQPMTDRDGNALLTTAPGGPVLERLFTGTGFVVSRDGLLITNRHVARPWDYDEGAQALLRQGLRPFMYRQVGYLPGHREGFPVTLVAAAAGADVALLSGPAIAGKVTPLPLSDAPARPGQEVFVLGYPTGMRALLARTSEAFVDSLLHSPSAGFWDLARRLARHDLIAPLATRGIVGQVSPSRVVYDAETTHGGSGGPVLGLDGTVVAVNAAILADFGGSNLGVPVAAARRLLSAHTAAEPAAAGPSH